MHTIQLQNFYHVYILRWADDSYYTGCTSNLNNRLTRHQRGEVHYTKSRLPFKVVNVASFPERHKAYAYEKYIKSGSGIAFRNKRLI